MANHRGVETIPPVRLCAPHEPSTARSVRALSFMRINLANVSPIDGMEDGSAVGPSVVIATERAVRLRDARRLGH